MTKELTCIRCPLGCRLTVTQDGERYTVIGNTCRRGEEYGVQEMRCPMRVVTTSVRVHGGVRKVCAVKTAGQVRKADISRVLEAIAKLHVQAPVAMGQVLCGNIAETGVSLVATASNQSVN